MGANDIGTVIESLWKVSPALAAFFVFVLLLIILNKFVGLTPPGNDSHLNDKINDHDLRIAKMEGEHGRHRERLNQLEDTSKEHISSISALQAIQEERKDRK